MNNLIKLIRTSFFSDSSEGGKPIGMFSADSEILRLQQELSNAQEQIQMFRALGKCLAQFSVSFGETQKSMAAMAGVMNNERDTAKSAAEISGKTRTKVTEISTNLQSMAVESSSAVNDVDELYGQSRKIGEIVEMIQKISAQTHLLSMNASVEAARAGEHGRGFAVVAKEVKNLSAGTSEATKEIVPLVQAIQHESSQVKQRMDALSIQSRQFSENGLSMAKDMGEALDLAQNMEHTISVSALRTFVELAKLDHLIFKFEIYKVFFGVTKKTADEIAHHQGCRLGKWYYEGEGLTLYSHLKGYREIEPPHKEVHASGKDALQLLEAGDIRGAVFAIAQMEKASLRVVENLEKMAIDGST